VGPVNEEERLRSRISNNSFWPPAIVGGPPPLPSTHIFPYKSRWCYVSTSQHASYENTQVGLPAAYFLKHFDRDWLPVEDASNTIFTFLLFLEFNTDDSHSAKKSLITPPKESATEGTTNTCLEAPTFPDSSNPLLDSSQSNMVGKKSGRALQLEEGTSSSFDTILLIIMRLIHEANNFGNRRPRAH
jgi:hypothetical protein